MLLVIFLSFLFIKFIQAFPTTQSHIPTLFQLVESQNYTVQKYFSLLFVILPALFTLLFKIVFVLDMAVIRKRKAQKEKSSEVAEQDITSDSEIESDFFDDGDKFEEREQETAGEKKLRLAKEMIALKEQEGDVQEQLEHDYFSKKTYQVNLKKIKILKIFSMNI